MTVQKAKFTENSAYLNTEFGLNLAVRKLGMTAGNIESVVGRYTKGKYKGQLRGKLVWFKIVEGGWISEIRAVCNTPNITFGYRVVDFNDNLLLGGIVNIPASYSKTRLEVVYYIHEIYEPQIIKNNQSRKAITQLAPEKSLPDNQLVDLLKETQFVIDGKNDVYNELDHDGKIDFLKLLKLALSSVKPEKSDTVYDEWLEVIADIIDMINELITPVSNNA